MDAIDILGSLLGQKSSRPSSKSSKNGSDILADIFGGRTKTKSAPSQTDLERQAKELEDLLNVSNDRHRQRTGAGGASSGSSYPQPPTTPSSHIGGYGSAPSSTRANDQALVLVKAMINASKADGQIDSEEQQNILKQFQSNSPETVQFLREEFQKPLDLNDFAASVPMGMEQQVYAMSLMAINLDTGQEAKYLMDLSQALRISPEVREQIHKHYGAPSIY
ncbi:MAG: tellurite resistance TerB family protein [bacterium]|nr:tellurite resistance TerB family protein [bacterium]